MDFEITVRCDEKELKNLAQSVQYAAKQLTPKVVPSSETSRVTGLPLDATLFVNIWERRPGIFSVGFSRTSKTLPKEPVFSGRVSLQDLINLAKDRAEPI